MNKKYEITTETKEINGHTVYRIKALKSFNTIIFQIGALCGKCRATQLTLD